MNVGTAQSYTINSSQPQLLHSPSQQSLAVSDHSSFSDYASGASTVGQRTLAPQYETPPSRAHSPITSKQAESEMTLPGRPLATRSPHTTPRPSPPPALERDSNDTSPPTPGVDESQYMRFAIEQLTRDEEITGRARQGSISSLEYSTERIVHDATMPYHSKPHSQAQESTSPKDSSPLSMGISKNRPNEGIFMPIEAPSHSQYPQLGYLPLVLRPAFLLLFICTCLLMIAGMMFCNLYSLEHDGLYDYDGTGTSRYFIFQFMPQLLGCIIIFWIFVLQAAVYRIIPFASLASQRFLDRVLQDMSTYPANFLLPDLTHFRSGEPVVGICLVVFWSSYLTVPLLSCIFQTELFDVDGIRQWRWTSVQEVVWVLVALYVLLAAAVALLLLRFRQKQSALVWDPVSLADLVVMFQKSNIVHDLDRSEISDSTRTHVPPRALRLGYWTTSTTSDIFYTIGEENAPARSGSTERIAQDERYLASGLDLAHLKVEYQRYSNAESFTRNIHSPFFRYRWAPWFLRDSAVFLWIVTALMLYLAFLIVSFVNRAVARGFLPRLATVTNSRGFSPSNFLFSFLPSFLGMILLLAWQPIDTYFRATQPFVNLSEPQGASAKHSLLLAYPSCFPFEATVLALFNRDFKVAWVSFVGVMSATIPALAGGIFTAQFFDQTEVRVAATMPAYYALCVFAGIYALSFLIVWPKRKRYLPHRLDTLADYLSFLYQSPLLTDPAFQGHKTKADLVANLVASHSRVGEEIKSRPQYSFGIYVGRDGREHLGIA